MAQILKFKEVISCSASDSVNIPENLLNLTGKWTTPKGKKNPPILKCECEFRIEAPALIRGLDVGNYWSSSIQVQVGNSTDSKYKRFTLMTPKILASRIDSVCGKKNVGESIRFFTTDDFEPSIAIREWDLIKIILEQPFKITEGCFGLTMCMAKGLYTTSIQPISTSFIEPTTPVKSLSNLISKAQSQLKNKNSPSIRETLTKRNDFRSRVRSYLRTVSSEINELSLIVNGFYEKYPDFLPTSNEIKELERLSKEYLKSKLIENDQFRPYKRHRNNSSDIEIVGEESSELKVTDRSKFVYDPKIKKSSKSSNYSKTSYSEESVIDTLIINDSPDRSFEAIDLTNIDSSPKPGPSGVRPKFVFKKSRSGKVSENSVPKKWHYFKNLSKKELLARNVLVQAKIFKKSKSLPLSEGKSLAVDVGTKVVFYKAGRSLWMECNNKFHIPDIEEEYVHLLFKDYSPQVIKIASKRYIEDNSKNHHEAIHVSSDEDELQCPLCGTRAFSNPSVLEKHSWSCLGKENTVSCPICSKTFEDSPALEMHAELCASKNFD